MIKTYYIRLLFLSTILLCSNGWAMEDNLDKEAGAIHKILCGANALFLAENDNDISAIEGEDKVVVGENSIAFSNFQEQVTTMQPHWRKLPFEESLGIYFSTVGMFSSNAALIVVGCVLEHDNNVDNTQSFASNFLEGKHATIYEQVKILTKKSKDSEIIAVVESLAAALAI